MENHSGHEDCCPCCRELLKKREEEESLRLYSLREDECMFPQKFLAWLLTLAFMVWFPVHMIHDTSSEVPGGVFGAIGAGIVFGLVLHFFIRGGLFIILGVIGAIMGWRHPLFAPHHDSHYKDLFSSKVVEVYGNAPNIYDPRRLPQSFRYIYDNHPSQVKYKGNGSSPPRVQFVSIS